VALSVGNNNANTTFSGTLDGPGSLIKLGSCSLVLSGSNNYIGGTIVTAGTLIATNSSAIPNGTSLTVGAGGAFIFDPSQASASPAAAVIAVPEPGTLVLLTVAAIGMLGWVWRRRRVA